MKLYAISVYGMRTDRLGISTHIAMYGMANNAYEMQGMALETVREKYTHLANLDVVVQEIDRSMVYRAYDAYIKEV